MKNSNQIEILGYAGHSYVCIEIAKLLNLKVNGYYDPKKNNLNPYSLNYLGTDKSIVGNKLLFVSVGDNIIRKRLFNFLLEKKFNVSLNLIHPKISLSDNFNIGVNNLINSGVIINTFVKIGNACIINTGAIIEHECNIGNFVHIAPGAILLGNVKIGDNSFIGANAVINPNIKIGKNVIVGSGSVVLNDISDNKTYVGNPAKPI